MTGCTFPLSKTDHPKVVFGTGDFFWDSSLSETKKIELIRRAVNGGVRLIDTAEAYGTAELTVGKSLSGLSNMTRVASKASPENLGYGDLIAACDRSLLRLGVDTIDIYQIHWPNNTIPLEETLEAMSALYKAGKISGVGLCNYHTEAVKKAIHLLKELNTPLLSCQMEYNLMERTIESNGILSLCETNGIVLLAYSPLDQGQTGMIPPKSMAVLQQVARKHGKTIPQVALMFLTREKPVYAVVRTTSPAHLNDNLSIAESKLDDEDVKEISDAFPADIRAALPSEIRVTQNGEWNRQAYETLDEAIENKLRLVPSPQQLAESLDKDGLLKPVRVVPSTSPNYKFDLVGGRLRYWAWVIANLPNEKPLPVYVRTQSQGE
ncbi:aldo/keto reductase [Alphaproteobacteria bacterium]|nr:aldo/keto reductase [Alphaproteobacteria bacterium]